MQSTKPPSSCWIITEGLIGTENQCIGVGQALGIPYDVKRISLKQPWKTLSPFLGLETQHSFTEPLTPPWPDLLITSGRKSIAASRYIKKQSSKKTFTLHIQDPRTSTDHFDLVAVPEHDPTRGDNVIVTRASPNKIASDLLHSAKQSFPLFENISSPRIAVLIGGKSKAYDMGEKTCTRIIEQLSALEGNLMITCSRRTGEENYKRFRDALDTPENFFWDGTGDNPYLGLLSWADYILVTADSASMISESCTTGKPVYMINLDGGATRIQNLHTNLIRDGVLKVFDGIIEPYSYEPLNDAQFVANEVKKHYEAFTLSYT
ncbi:MAG: mitochondrial fission ELM1 family protein [Alphaproteobacteria bacterium]